MQAALPVEKRRVTRLRRAVRDAKDGTETKRRVDVALSTPRGGGKATDRELPRVRVRLGVVLPAVVVLIVFGARSVGFVQVTEQMHTLSTVSSIWCYMSWGIWWSTRRHMTWVHDWDCWMRTGAG